MVPSFIYIMATILGVLLGMSYIGFRYYKRQYNNIKTKYDEIGGDDTLNTKNEIEKLEKKCSRLKKENDSLKEADKKRKRRRGLHKRTVVRTHDQHQIHIECEVVEVDRTRGKSKIEVLHINCGETLDSGQREQIKELVNGWLEDSDIEWFEKPLDEVRTNKIDDILEDDK